MIKKRYLMVLTVAIVSVLLGSLFYQVLGGKEKPPTDVNIVNPIDEEGNLKVTQMNGEQNVTVTNFPKANNHLTAILNVQQHEGSDPYVLSASNEVTGIGNKTVTFISGEVSGGTTWSSQSGNYWAIAGETPGIGRVEVYDSYNTLMAQFVLPLNAMFEVQNVSMIKVYAESPIPKLTDNVGYSAYVVASIYWIEQ